MVTSTNQTKPTALNILTSLRLAKKDRGAEAIDILAKIQARGNVDDPLVVAEWEEITTTLAAERSAPPGWRKFVLNGMWKRTLAGFTVQMWQQNSGANVSVQMDFC